MGGSLAKALSQRTDFNLTGFDINQLTINQALAEGVVHQGYSKLEQLNWESFDLIFLCTPVEKTLELMKEIDGKVKNTGIVTDICSTKAQVMNIAEGLSYNFIGGHPMVGSEKNGYDHSKAHLYENAYYILTPEKNVNDEKLQILEEIIVRIGSIPIKLTAEKHDLVTAVISHVPHIVAAALVNLTASYEDGQQLLLRLAAGGFKDLTRIASGDPALWKQISLSNGEKIDGALQKLINILADYRGQLQERNEGYTQEFFHSAKRVRDQLKDAVTTDIPLQASLIVDIEDRPGMIAQISTLLYENKINIKNIGIIHNREFENGCLKIILENRQDKELAAMVLNKSYSVFE